MEHLLMSYSQKKEHNEIPDMPEGAYYDEIKGYWIKGKSLLISYESEFETLSSKKADVETGEDMKGE